VSYSAAQAERLAGCSASQLHHWSRTGVVTPSDSDGRYSFGDLVALRVVRALLDAGTPSARALAAVRALREEGDDLAAVRLVADGRQIVVCRDDGQLLDALGSGQLALFVAVDRVAAQLEIDVRTFTRERAEFVEHLVARG
jgi:DNA-binding transcriptional MerR regulator